MTPDEQLNRWCAGESVHNEERGECCPDFSCCDKSINTPMNERELFKNRPELRDAMLLGFLGRTLRGVPAYVAGSTGGEA